MCVLGLLLISALGVFIGNELFYITMESTSAYACYDEESNDISKNIVSNKQTKDEFENYNLLSNKANKQNREMKNKDTVETKDNNSVGKFKGEKICYLTFDDGPTRNITPQILEILKEKDVKATFFVLGKLAEVNQDILKREKNEGHLIANHTYSHDYAYLYTNPENLINDINKNQEMLNNILGEELSKIISFQGGSFNKKSFQKRVNEEGYHFVDWNCLNGDAEALNVPEDKLFNNVKKSMGSQEHIIVLMHDASTKQTTVRSLSRIIDYIKAQGYSFKTLAEAFYVEKGDNQLILSP